MKTILKILLVLAFMFIGFVFFVKHELENRPPIDFSSLELTTLDDMPYDLNSNQPKVVNIWATWCAPCIKEFPAFENVKRKYGDKVDFVMISDESSAKINDWRIKQEYTFTFITSKSGFGARPVTYFLDGRGNVNSRKIGGLSESDLEDGVSKLLASE